MTQAGTRQHGQQSAADTDPESIEAFAKRLISNGFVISEKGKEARQPTLAEAMLVAHAAKKYDLDPLMGEVGILGSKLYTGLDGMRKSARKIARDNGERYCERARPATIEEAQVAFVTDDGEQYWICDIIVGGETIATGHGFAEAANVAIGRVWENGRPAGIDRRIIRNMAENRAVRRALKAAYGLPFAEREEIERETAPTVMAQVVTPPTTGQPQVYAAIPEKPASAPTTTLAPATEPQREKVPVKKAAPATSAPAAQSKPVPLPKGYEQPKPLPTSAPADPGPISPEEARGILEREAAEERAAAERERARGDR